VFGKTEFMTRALPCLLALTLLFSSSAALADAPPTARQAAVTDAYFGEQVVDPYRWMEAVDAEFVGWARAQDALTRRELSALPGYPALAESVAAFSGGLEPAGYVKRVGDDIFYVKRPRGTAQNRLFVRSLKTGVERELLDPVAGPGGGPLMSISYFSPSMDGTLVALGLANAGSEDADLVVLRVADGTLLPDRIDRARFGSPNWDPDGRSFYYGRLLPFPPDGDPAKRFADMRIYRHVLGDDPEKDVQVFRIMDHDSAIGVDGAAGVGISEDGRYAFAIANSGVSLWGEWWVSPIEAVRAGKPTWLKIGDLDDQLLQASATGNGLPPVVEGDTALFLTLKDAPHGKLVRVSLTRADAPAETVVPEGEAILTQFVAAADGLYLLRTGPVGAGLTRLNTRTGETLAIPGSDTGAIIELAADIRRPDVIFSLETWTRPAALQLSAGSRLLTPLVLGSPFSFDLSQVVSEETTITAADGVEIPVSIIHRADLKRDGSARAIFEAYGAYGFSMDPAFTPRTIPWVLQGGIYVVVHVRGGGERGEPWHLAGMKGTKPNTWRDMIAAIETLQKRGYTGPGRVAVTGTSAGGIMVGRVLTERPDLLAAAIMNVPMADALRNELTEGGPSNTAEFGSTATEAGYRALRVMSPYANVVDGTRYPPVLVTGGLNDHRVPVWMAGKMAARLQAATPGPDGIRLRVDFDAGHGVGSNKAQRDATMADTLAFILRATGHPDFQPGR
jgi:prolyl oligopeptidase